MTATTRWTLCLLATFCVAGFVAADSVAMRSAAAPEIIVFTGAALREPVRTTGMARNHAFTIALSPARITDADLADRAHIDVYMYWGIHHAACARDAACLESLRPEAAETRGRLYLANGEQPPVYEPLWPPNTTGRRVVSSDGVAWLESQVVGAGAR